MFQRFPDASIIRSTKTSLEKENAETNYFLHSFTFVYNMCVASFVGAANSRSAEVASRGGVG
eukprot:2177705-Pyramimonas_sp.AAC.1